MYAWKHGNELSNIVAPMITALVCMRPRSVYFDIIHGSSMGGSASSAYALKHQSENSATSLRQIDAPCNDGSVPKLEILLDWGYEVNEMEGRPCLPEICFCGRAILAYGTPNEAVKNKRFLVLLFGMAVGPGDTRVVLLLRAETRVNGRC